MLLYLELSSSKVALNRTPCSEDQIKKKMFSKADE